MNVISRYDRGQRGRLKIVQRTKQAGGRGRAIANPCCWPNLDRPIEAGRGKEIAGRRQGHDDAFKTGSGLVPLEHAIFPAGLQVPKPDGRVSTSCYQRLPIEGEDHRGHGTRMSAAGCESLCADVPYYNFAWLSQSKITRPGRDGQRTAVGSKRQRPDNLIWVGYQACFFSRPASTSQRITVLSAPPDASSFPSSE